ncbi:MAG: Gfo/Idh/MocA family oxidoreductase [Verrucomicrobiia bacterium]
MNKINVALIGAGYWGQNLARNFNKLGVLHTICDADSNTLQKYNSGYENVNKTTLLQNVLANSEINCVAVAAPAALHYEIAKAALNADKDVFVEKPLSLEVSQGEELVALAQKKQRILMVGHLLQYHPCIEKLKQLIKNGELGCLYYITSNRLNLGKIRREENALWSFAPHDISVILALAGGQMPIHVSCYGESYLTRGVADTTLTILKFQNGLQSHIYVSWLNPFKEQKLTVVGSEGMAVFDDTQPWQKKLILYRGYLKWDNGVNPIPVKRDGEPVTVPEEEPLLKECKHFIECCQNRSTPRTNGDEALKVLKVLQLAQKSLETCCPESVNQPSTPAKDYYVHPTAVVDDGAVIGKGTKIWHFCHIMPGAIIGEKCVLGQNVNVDKGAKIGNNVKIQNNVSIYTGIEIEDDVFLGPSCVLTNVTNPRSQVNRHSLYERTLIKRGATIGANATIVCGITIGQYAFVGAGSVVTKDVPDYALVVGNPAKQVGWMSRHGHKLKPGPDGIMVCPESGFRYKEVSQGVLRCLDYPEDKPLPPELSKGSKSYDEFKQQK